MRTKPVARSHESFFAALRRAGMIGVPEEFSVACVQQEIPRSIMQEIEAFIAIFNGVTTRSAWQRWATAAAPEIARQHRPEVCFFSAWDFHLPPASPAAWQLIELNDNGSGIVFAEHINRVFYEACGLDRREDLQPPLPISAFADHLAAMIAEEAQVFFGARPAPALLILDDAESLARGRFRRELMLLADLLRAREWQVEIGPPEALRWDGRRLLWRDVAISFVINRSTDFFWEGAAFSALRAAFRDGQIYVAPNPFTYATRSDKRLLERLSRPDWDHELGIGAAERTLLSRHVPETRLLRAEDLDLLADTKDAQVFKPAQGFAGRGLLPTSQVGRSRLRRLLQRGVPYVAQRRVSKPSIDIGGQRLWTDLRVWSYREQRFLVSGRASRDPERMDLRSPGGWLPTYVHL